MSQKISIRNCRRQVQNQWDFDAGNVYAKTLAPGVYVVYSYGPHFPMFANICGRWYANSDGYSRTTAKHKGQADPFDKWMEYRDTGGLKDLIDETIRIVSCGREAA
jgi:hypothetical protein